MPKCNVKALPYSQGMGIDLDFPIGTFIRQKL